MKHKETSPTFTPLQSRIFYIIAKNKMLSSQCYFTGGTALSAFYLHHRESEDLDFFSENDFDDTYLHDFVNELSTTLGFSLRYTKRYRSRICELLKDKKLIIKVDFVYHPHRLLEKGITHKGITIDSLRDIATNKLLTVNQRTEVKDFVDLYFLLKKFTIWDLIYGIEAKYRMELDTILIALDFMKAQQFTFLPKMLVPLTLRELKTFFKKKALEVGKRIVE